jgi:8-oxo-dGTP pyrophosphatase MutT (NUDIX family)
MTQPRRAFSVAIFARPRTGPMSDRILLIHHRRLNTWLPVGGELNEGETPLEAARRELHEETGWHGDFTSSPDLAIEGTPSGWLHYEEHDAGSKGTHLNGCFVARVDGDVPTLNDEATDFAFVDRHLRSHRPEHPFPLPAPANVIQLVQCALADGRHPAVLVAQAWLDHFNGRRLSSLLDLYDDDAVHTSPKLRERQPETGGQVRGKQALRAWWQDAFDRLPDLHYEARAITAARDRVFLEYTRTVEGQPPMVVAELFIVQRGLIVESHVFHG